MKTPISLFAILVLFTASGSANAAPPSTIPEVARAAGEFRFLLLAVERAGLNEALSADGPLTVFAPDDSAFAALPREDLANLLRAENRGRLRHLLGLHVVSGKIGSPDLLLSRSVKTLSGEELLVVYEGGKLSVGGARIVTADIPCKNGIVHVISSVIAPAAPDASPSSGTRLETRELLITAIEQGAPVFNRGDSTACAGIYEMAARTALSGDGLDAGEEQMMRKVLNSLPTLESDGKRAWALRRAFDQILSGRVEQVRDNSLEKAPGFKVRLEAPLPKGFPMPGPVGEVIVKQYPRYRMARAAGGRSAFGTLFMHIKKNDIAMTAPVEMTMVPAGNDSLTSKDMAFLYESTSQGEAGQDGRVAVKDLNPMTVLSVGLRGPLTADKIALARRALEAELKSRGDLERAGPFRQMGYNSPFISPRERFYELQLPVSKSEDR